MSGKRVTLTIDAPPWPSRNVEDGMHWTAKRDTRGVWGTYAVVAWHHAGRPVMRHPIVTVRLYFAERRRRDRDNFTAGSGMKGLLDGLKGRAFTDDADGVIDLRPVEFGVDKLSPHVEILLEEAAQ